MARYDANRNRGHHYGLVEPRYEGPKQAVIGYSASSQSYATTREEVVQYGGFPVRQMELFKNFPRAGDISLLQTALGMTHIDDRSSHNEWPSHHERPRKGDHISSPRFSQPNGSPRNKAHRDNSPPSKDHHYGKYQNFDSDESDEDDSHNYERQPPLGYPLVGPHLTHPKQDPYHENPNGHGYNPPSYIVPVSTHPKKNSYHETSYNPRDTYNERPKSSAYSPPSYNERPKDRTYSHPSYNEKPKDGVYGPPSYNERPKGSAHNPPSYTSHESTHPKNDEYPETYKGSAYNPPPYAAPYYETSTDRPLQYNPPPPIITSFKGGVDHLTESARNSPVAQRSPFNTSSPRSPFISSPRKEHDNMEAHRRYEKAPSPRYGAPAAEQYIVSTIDSEEAARKYNGIFVKMK